MNDMYSMTVPVIKGTRGAKPDMAEIHTPFFIGQEIVLEYDMPRRCPVAVGYADIWESPVRTKRGRFQISEILCNMLVFPHENMIRVESLDVEFDTLYPGRKTMLLFESTVLKRMVETKEHSDLEGCYGEEDKVLEEGTWQRRLLDRQKHLMKLFREYTEKEEEQA